MLEYIIDIKRILREKRREKSHKKRIYYAGVTRAFF